MKAFAAGEYESACPLLEQAIASRPQDAQLLLNLAVSQYSCGQYDKAEVSYRRLLGLRPDDARVCFELGRTLTERGQFEEARELFERLRRQSPPQELRGGLDAMLDRLDELERRTSFMGNVKLSVISDDNVNVGPSGRTLGNITFDPDTQPKSATGLGASFMLGVERKLDPMGKWRLSGGVAHNAIRYDRYDDYDVGVTSLSTRLSHALERGSLQASLNYMDIEQGGANSINIFSPSMMWLQAVAQDKQLITEVNLEFRDTVKTSSSDSVYWAWGEYLRWFFGQGNKHYVLFGGRLFTENARSARKSNDGYELKVAPSFQLPWSLRLDLSVALENTDYRAPAASGQSENREDDKLTYSAALSRSLWCDEATACLRFTHKHNESNYVPNDYYKNTGEFSVTYRF